MDDYGVDLLKSALGSDSGRSAGKSSSRPFKKKDVPSLAQFIQSDACGKICLMVIFSSRNSFHADFVKKKTLISVTESLVQVRNPQGGVFSK
jgi:hypothetical protein